MIRYLSYIVFISIFILPGCEKEHGNKQATPSRDFQAGEYYDYYDVPDSAFYFYNRVVNTSGDSLEKGIAYFKMGLSQLQAGDYYSAQESLLSSIKALNEKDAEHSGTIAADYNTLANATLELKDYDAAIKNYRLALKFSSAGDPRLYILNNLGVAYQKKGDYPKAISIFTSAVKEPTADTSLKAMLISNLARTRWLADQDFNALPALRAALSLRKTVKDSGGMNASLAHLSDYYAGTRPDSALYYAKRRFEIAGRLGDPNNRLEALGQLARLSPPGETKQYLQQYMALSDSMDKVHSRSRNQYALIKFDAAKSKADNLILQKDLVRQRLIIWGTVVFASLFIIGFILWTRARRKKLKQASENAIRESKLKTSQKVHDVVANGLYRIMNELEHQPVIYKGPLLNKIEGLYEQSRDISYEQEPQECEEYDQEIHQLLTSYASDQTKIILVGNQQKFWSRVSAFEKQELRLVLEELLVNMQKHSRAKNVVFHFREENGTGQISYKDDGVGFPVTGFGNGLNNTVNRMHSINGKIIFEDTIGKGASIVIRFPLRSI